MLFKINLVQYNVSGFLYRVAMGVVLGFHYIVYFLGPLEMFLMGRPGTPFAYGRFQLRWKFEVYSIHFNDVNKAKWGKCVAE